MVCVHCLSEHVGECLIGPPKKQRIDPIGLFREQHFHCSDPLLETRAVANVLRPLLEQIKPESTLYAGGKVLHLNKPAKKGTVRADLYVHIKRGLIPMLQALLGHVAAGYFGSEQNVLFNFEQGSVLWAGPEDQVLHTDFLPERMDTLACIFYVTGGAATLYYPHDIRKESAYEVLNKKQPAEIMAKVRPMMENATAGSVCLFNGALLHAGARAEAPRIVIFLPCYIASSKNLGYEDTEMQYTAPNLLNLHWLNELNPRDADSATQSLGSFQHMFMKLYAWHKLTLVHPMTGWNIIEHTELYNQTLDQVLQGTEGPQRQKYYALPKNDPTKIAVYKRYWTWVLKRWWHALTEKAEPEPGEAASQYVVQEPYTLVNDTTRIKYRIKEAVEASLLKELVGAEVFRKMKRHSWSDLLSKISEKLVANFNPGIRVEIVNLFLSIAAILIRPHHALQCDREALNFTLKLHQSEGADAETFEILERNTRRGKYHGNLTRWRRRLQTILAVEPRIEQLFEQMWETEEIPCMRRHFKFIDNLLHRYVPNEPKFMVAATEEPIDEFLVLLDDLIEAKSGTETVRNLLMSGQDQLRKLRMQPGDRNLDALFTVLARILQDAADKGFITEPEYVPNLLNLLVKKGGKRREALRAWWNAHRGHITVPSPQAPQKPTPPLLQPEFELEWTDWLDERMPAVRPLLSMGLFKGETQFDKYFSYGLYTIRTLREAWPALDMVIYVSENVNATEKTLLAKAAYGKLKIVVVRFIGAGGVSADPVYYNYIRVARFFPIFAEPNRTVIVIDVHDNPVEIMRNIRKVLGVSGQTSMRVYLTYWLAEGSDCLACEKDARIAVKNTPALYPRFKPRNEQRPVHSHADGGFSVWHPTKLRSLHLQYAPKPEQRMINPLYDSFESFVSRYIKTHKTGYVAALDEMILACYLAQYPETNLLGDKSSVLLYAHPFTNERGRFKDHEVPPISVYEDVDVEELDEESKEISVKYPDSLKQAHYVCTGVD